MNTKALLAMADRLYQIAILKQEAWVLLLQGFKGFEEKAKEVENQSWRQFLEGNLVEIEVELLSRGIEWRPTPITGNRKIELLHRGALERYLVGALRDSINAHGDITKDNAPSAAKRLIGAIKTWNQDSSNRNN